MMRRITLLLCCILMSFFTFAQNLTVDNPVTVSSGDKGQQFYSLNENFISAPLSLSVVTSDADKLYESVISTDNGTYSLASPTPFFDGSGEFSIFYRDVGFGFGVFPSFHKTGTVGSSPNRDVTLERRSASGFVDFNQTYSTPEDDFGLKTIGTIDGDGALTIAARQSPNDSLFQLVAIKTNSIGVVTWESIIPIENTGYDDIFQGVDANGNFIEQIMTVPPVTIVESTNDGGYIIVNPNKKYYPPGSTRQYANIIKLSGTGEFLWNNNLQIPWRELEIGSNPSEVNDRFRGRVSSVEGTSDGSVYITFSSSGDINPNAQFRKFDNTGAIVEIFSTSWSFDGNVSYLIKELNNRIYWLKFDEIFYDAGPPTLENDFAIFDITDGFTIIESSNFPAAAISATPGTTFIPLDLTLTEEGDFLVTGTEYTSGPAPDNVALSDTPCQPFVVLLENNNPADFADVELAMTTTNSGVGIYENITIDLTVINTGQADATFLDVVVNGIAGEVVFAGETTPVASLGTFTASGAIALWDVGTLAAGESATASVTFFTLAANTSFCAEVSTLGIFDSDSEPGNNSNCNTPLEDDEATLIIGQQSGTIQGTVFMDDERDGGQNCSGGQPCTFISGIQLNLYIQGTNTLVGSAISQADGTYIFQNVPAGSYNLEYEYQDDLVVTPYFNGPFGFEFRNNFVDNGFETPYIGVSINNNSTNVVRNLGLVDGTECTLDELFVETICDDNGTPSNPNDDTFQVNFRADGQGRAAFSLNGSNGALWNNSITYSEGFELIGPFDINELPVTLTLDNLGNLPEVSCSLSEQITSVNCTGTGSDLPDLTFINEGLSFPVQASNGQQFIQLTGFKAKNIGTTATPSGFYPTRAFLSNNPTYSADDVEVDFFQFQTFPAGQEFQVPSLSLPDNLTTGTYYLFYFIDPANSLVEANEDNNVFTFPIEILEGEESCSINFSGGANGISFCMDNGTPTDPSDDFFNLNLTPNLVFGSGNYSIEIPTINTDGTVSYQTETHPAGTTIFQSFNIQDAEAAFGDAGILFTVADAADPSCVGTIVFGIPDICSQTGNGGVDLELSASEDVPSIYQSGQATFTLTNTGSEDATGILIEFNKNSSLNITATPTVSQGTPQVHWTDTPRWNVGNLAAGQSATITFDIFALSDDVSFYGQVTAQNENDADSSPDNGNGTTPVEDDEASYPGDGGNTGGGNQADLILANLNVLGQATAGEIVEYTVFVSNIGTATAAGNYIIGAYLSTNNQLSTDDVQVGVINTGNTPIGTEPLTTGSITIPANQTPGNYFLILETDTNGDIAESDETNNIIFVPIYVESIDNCNLIIDISTVSCSTNGTPNDPTDDTYSFDFTVFVGNAGGSVLIDSNADLPIAVTLGETYTVTDIPANAPPVIITATTPNNTSCQATTTVNPPGTCGQDTGENDGVDLVVNIITETTTIGQYENVALNYNIINTGTETATGVVVYVPKPDGVVYVGGNEFELTQGTFELFGSQLWEVGNVEPGDNLSLTVNYFTLSAGQVIAWTEVSAMNENDTDSTPGNGTPFVSSSEDDEYRLVLNVGNLIGNGQSTARQSQNTSELSANLYPVPTHDELTVEVFSESTSPPQLSVHDTNGKMIWTMELAAHHSKQTVRIATENWIDGIYFLQLFDGKEMQTYHFIKM